MADTADTVNLAELERSWRRAMEKSRKAWLLCNEAQTEASRAETKRARVEEETTRELRVLVARRKSLESRGRELAAIIAKLSVAMPLGINGAHGAILERWCIVLALCVRAVEAYADAYERLALAEAYLRSSVTARSAMEDCAKAAYDLLKHDHAVASREERRITLQYMEVNAKRPS